MSRSNAKPLVSFDVVFGDALTEPVGCPQIVLRDNIPLLRRPPQPLHPLGIVVQILVTVSEPQLRIGVALFRRVAILVSRLERPPFRFDKIFWHPQPRIIQASKRGLCRRVPLFSPLPKPLGCLRVVLWNLKFPELAVANTKFLPGIRRPKGVVLFSSFAIPFGRFQVALRHPLAIHVRLSE